MYAEMEAELQPFGFLTFKVRTSGQARPGQARPGQAMLTYHHGYTVWMVLDEGSTPRKNPLHHAIAQVLMIPATLSRANSICRLSRGI